MKIYVKNYNSFSRTAVIVFFLLSFIIDAYCLAPQSNTLKKSKNLIFYKNEINKLKLKYAFLKDPSKPFKSESIDINRSRFMKPENGIPYPQISPYGDKTFWGIIGYPLPMDDSLKIFVRQLNDFLRNKEYGPGLDEYTLYIQPEKDLHNSVVTIQDPRDSDILTKDERITELKKILRRLNKVKTFKIVFNDVIVTDTGEILITGEPLDVEYFKIRKDLDLKAKDVVHISFGRFLGIPEFNRSQIIYKLNNWLNRTYGGRPFGCLNVSRENWQVVLHETHWYFYNNIPLIDFMNLDIISIYLNALKSLEKIKNNLQKDNSSQWNKLLPDFSPDQMRNKGAVKNYIQGLEEELKSKPENLIKILKLLGYNKELEKVFCFIKRTDSQNPLLFLFSNPASDDILSAS